ncbi:hypothetical protein PV08_00346 [Exophiala spinifera]|uniref:Protein ARV n=1 Tax=Exophiala spinifera TaxID=91928 RepID=A0A0D2A4K9_9EURO|nr:uncharacterized protein PV08_00346 [Exophiala spinifera]KIW19772.1 hypothetical protein PV08_00346 [Exophiala spinifera]
MPICITCSTPVKNLYTVYSKADDRTLGKGVRLTQCPNCKRFADKYVEHDFVVLFIDLVLIKPQVYRHLLFNRLGRSDNRLDPSILRLGILLVLFDVYITWARIEKSSTVNGGNNPNSALTGMPILTQYLFFLTMNVLATAAQHAIIRFLARFLVTEREQHGDHPNSKNSPRVSSADGNVHPIVAPGQASPSAISTALLVSSCTKLFPIFLVIWPTEVNGGGPSGFAFRATNYVAWAVLVNNIEALLILLNCGYVAATGMAVSGMLARWAVEYWALRFVGLGSDPKPLGGLATALNVLKR